VKRRTRVALAAAGFAYALFAAGCFRLAAEHGYERSVSIGEGLFVLLGAVGFFVAASVSRWQDAVVILGTMPLVGWFVATQWNSGPPFLVASLIAPCIACALLARNWLVRTTRL
jgi:membrane protease YdiL (CAAX protease family)